MTRSTSSVSIMAVIVSAVGLRWLFCFWLFPAVLAPHSTIGRTYYVDTYRKIAESVVTGHGYRLGEDGPPALHRPPGYLAVVLLCRPSHPGVSFVWLHMLQGLLGGASAWLTLRAARAWGVSRGGALFSGWVVALWPFAIWETRLTVPENLLLDLVPAVYLLLAHVPRSLVYAVLAGAVGAWAAMTHGLYQALLFPLAFSPGFLKITLRRKVAATLLIAGSFIACLTPWVLRNERLGYRGVATGFGYHYFFGNYVFDALLNDPPFFRDHDAAATASVSARLRSAGYPGIETDAERSDPRINQYLDHLAVDHIEAHPLYVLSKVLITMPLAWVAQRTPRRSVVNGLLLAPLLILAIRGLLRRRSLFLLALPVLCMNAAASLVFSGGIPMRYVLPLMPLLAILAGAGLAKSCGSAESA